MDREEVLNQMIAEKRRLIELYQAMIAEWERELGLASAAPRQGEESSNKPQKSVNGGDILSLVRDWEFFKKSQPEAAKAFLEKVGHPAKTQTILDAIVKGGVTVGGKESSRKLNLYTILHRSPEFALIAKDTWALVGWPGVTKKEKESNESTATDEKESKSEAK